MTPAALAWREAQAAHQVAVDAIAGDLSPDVRARIDALLFTPQLRDGDLYAGKIGESYVREIDAGEDPAEMVAWWWRLRDLLALSWADLHTIPANERTTDFLAVQETVLALAIKQAKIESGLPVEVVSRTAADAAERKRTLDALTPSELAELARATGVADRSRAMQVAALEGQISEMEDGDERDAARRKLASLRRRRTG